MESVEPEAASGDSYRVGVETEGFNVEKCRCRFTVQLPASLTGVAWEFPGNA